MTENNQPHLHLIIGMIRPDVVACKKKAKYDREWRESACECLEHMASRYWYEVTGHSYVVDARRVRGKFGIASYLSKYLVKSYGGDTRERLEDAGFLRRYSCSRNWPRGAHMKRRGTIEKSWRVEGWEKGHKREIVVKAARSLREMEQVGTDMAQKLADDRMIINGMRRARKYDSSTDG